MDLLRRCRRELEVLRVPGEVALIVDPEDDPFAARLCTLLGTHGGSLTLSSIPAASLIAGLAGHDDELGPALRRPPPRGHSWVVVIGRGSAGLALLPHAVASLS
jgi:hypothetical protein